MWVVSALISLAGAMARWLGFNKYRAGRKQGQTEVRLENAEQEIKAREAQAKVAADVGGILSPHELAERMRRDADL